MHSEILRYAQDDSAAGRARFFAEFALSEQGEILRFAQNDSEGLRITAVKHLSATCCGA